MAYTDTPEKSDITIDEEENMEEAPQTEGQKKLARKVQTLFRGSFNAKDQMDLMTKWAMFDDYKHGIQNEPMEESDPGSTTNIIHPIIESQISDLVDKPYDVEAAGREPGDHLFADDVQHAMKYIFDRNQFEEKLNTSEHDRLELGTTAIKVFTKDDGTKKLPTFEIISPANFFPDPKWTSATLLQDCEFIIHAVPRPLSYFRKEFPKMGQYVHREITCPYDPDLDTDNFKTDEVEVATSEKALLIECYMRDENGDIYCVHVANHIVLEDSREVLKDKKLQRRNQFPFVAIPCYIQRGTGWGQGDVELLIPTQDIINDLDDQIRMTARAMGNPQIVVGQGMGKGFDYRKWTNAPGLRIPGRDPSAWKLVQPSNVSSDVPNRREKAFEEANIISGRPDVNRGESPGGGVTAASAIIALQQAGQKGVLHKTKMFKQGWKKVLELLYDEMVEHWDEGMWVRVNGDQPDFKFINLSRLKEIQIMVPNDNPIGDEDTVKELLDEELKPMTREAEFDLNFSMGNGLPTDTAFVYQTLLDLSKLVVEGKSILSWQELRDYLRDHVGLPLGSDEQFQQQMAGLPPGMPGPMGGAPLVNQGQP